MALPTTSAEREPFGVLVERTSVRMIRLMWRFRKDHSDRQGERAHCADSKIKRLKINVYRFNASEGGRACGDSQEARNHNRLEGKKGSGSFLLRQNGVDRRFE